MKKTISAARRLAQSLTSDHVELSTLSVTVSAYPLPSAPYSLRRAAAFFLIRLACALLRCDLFIVIKSD